jgi:hypothetical protein
MALNKRTEFAEKCNLSPGNLSNYIARGKVILSGDYIDDSIDPNKSFLLKRQTEEYTGKRDIEPVQELPPKSKKEPSKKKELQIKDPVKVVPPVPNVGESQKFQQKRQLFDVDLDQKMLDLETSKENLELIKLKKEKIQGVVIPTDQAKIVVIQLSKSFTVAFSNASDDILTQMSKKKGFSAEEVADLRGSFRKIINSAVNEAVDSAKKQIKNIVSEYSERRGVGERT